MKKMKNPQQTQVSLTPEQERLRNSLTRVTALAKIVLQRMDVLHLASTMDDLDQIHDELKVMRTNLQVASDHAGNALDVMPKIKAQKSGLVTPANPGIVKP